MEKKQIILGRLDLKTFVSVRGKQYCVSTVQLPAPEIDGGEYETAVFRAKDGKVVDWLDLYCRRYISDIGARRGHEETVAALEAGELPLHEEGEK